MISECFFIDNFPEQAIKIKLLQTIYEPVGYLISVKVGDRIVETDNKVYIYLNSGKFVEVDPNSPIVLPKCRPSEQLVDMKTGYYNEQTIRRLFNEAKITRQFREIEPNFIEIKIADYGKFYGVLDNPSFWNSWIVYDSKREPPIDEKIRNALNNVIRHKD